MCKFYFCFLHDLVLELLLHCFTNYYMFLHHLVLACCCSVFNFILFCLIQTRQLVLVAMTQMNILWATKWKWRVDSASHCIVYLFVCVCECVCYLSSAETNHQVSYKGVLCFSWAVAHHHTPAVLLGQLTPERQQQYEHHICSQMQTCTETHVSMSMHQIHTKSTHALIASVTEPIWLTFSNRQLQAFSSTARCILRGLVTVRSSPTTCTIYTTKLYTD